MLQSVERGLEAPTTHRSPLPYPYRRNTAAAGKFQLWVCFWQTPFRLGGRFLLDHFFIDGNTDAFSERIRVHAQAGELVEEFLFILGQALLLPLVFVPRRGDHFHLKVI